MRRQGPEQREKKKPVLEPSRPGFKSSPRHAPWVVLLPPQTLGSFSRGTKTHDLGLSVYVESRHGLHSFAGDHWLGRKDAQETSLPLPSSPRTPIQAWAIPVSGESAQRWISLCLGHIQEPGASNPTRDASSRSKPGGGVGAQTGRPPLLGTPTPPAHWPGCHQLLSLGIQWHAGIQWLTG